MSPIIPVLYSKTTFMVILQRLKIDISKVQCYRLVYTPSCMREDSMYSRREFSCCSPKDAFSNENTIALSDSTAAQDGWTSMQYFWQLLTSRAVWGHWACTTRGGQSSYLHQQFEQCMHAGSSCLSYLFHLHPRMVNAWSTESFISRTLPGEKSTGFEYRQRNLQTWHQLKDEIIDSNCCTSSIA